MPDQSYLDWPFFDDSHRDLAERLKTWVATHVAEEHETDEYAATRALVKKLGQGGWLKHCVPSPFGGVQGHLSVRALCLIRETLAWHSGLARA